MGLSSSHSLNKAIHRTMDEALRLAHEYVTPEHFLYALPLSSSRFCDTLLDDLCIDPELLQSRIENVYFKYLDTVPLGEDGKPTEAPMESEQFNEVFSRAGFIALSSQSLIVTIPHVIGAIMQLDETSFARNLLYELTDGDPTELIACLTSAFGSGREEEEEEDDDETTSAIAASADDDTDDEGDEDDEDDDEDDDDDMRGFNPMGGKGSMEAEFLQLLQDLSKLGDAAAPQRPTPKENKSNVNLTDQMRQEPNRFTPLIGRRQELDRMMQVLCRCEKGNPLIVGDPGVGKTALVHGLAHELVNNPSLPQPLQDANIFVLNIASILAKSEYRGQVEKNLHALIDEVSQHSNPIVLIEDIHQLVGAGRSEGTLDAASVLRPYFSGGKVRFIGTTTHAEYNRHLAGAPGMMRCFQRIDLDEPTEAETVQIIMGIRDRYEEHHRVELNQEIIQYAVAQAARYINERCLPDKAIDLIDETGGWMRMHPQEGAVAPDGMHTQGNHRFVVEQVMTQKAINQVLSSICHVDALADGKDERDRLEKLEPSILGRIYGQDSAVRQVVEAVQMSHAGLLEDGKPVASFLFVGPTGVGKTEVARVLAQELGVELIRFDMSEYTERHTVSKLIGSPAGYVGYDDGGLLTDAVRKNPHCVLLFDEIEKAHPSVYNIFLQMMDYARVTDNKGRKADFRHAVIIFTSNAGAQFASQAAMGFTGGISKGESMLGTVKKTFKPEFIARLSATVVFNDMDEHMASLILDKKLNEFRTRLAARHVDLEVSAEARAFLLRKGYSNNTGAREMDHVIAQYLRPLFTRAMLFGSLREGGKAVVTLNDKEELTLTD